MENISDLKEMLEKTTSKYGNKIVYQLNNQSISYEMLLEKVNCLGTKLLDMGLKGKNIAILSENRYEWEISYFAITCGTGVVVPLDVDMPKIEIDRIIRRAEVEAVICSKQYEDIVKELDLKYIISMDLKESTKKVLSEKQLLEQGRKLIQKGDRNFIDAKINPNQLGFIYFTSGTTDESKAVMLSHKNICSNLKGSASVFHITSEDIVLSVVSLSHVLEGLFCFLVSIFKGAKRVYSNDIKNILQDIKNYNVTFMVGVPALYEMIYEELIHNKDYQDINKQVRAFFSGGATLNIKTKEAYQKIGINLLQGYGLTEAAPVIALENNQNQKKGTVGKVIPGIQAKLKNINEYGIGELLIKGDNVMLGYYKNNEATQKVIKQGWLYTNDLAKIDQEGYMYLCGRKKDMIILKNGKKIFPEELEKILDEIRGIKESFIFAKEKVYAKIVYDDRYFTSKNLKQIQSYILNQINNINKNLPTYKHIKIIDITDEPIYRNLGGKIKRKQEIERLEKNQMNEKKVLSKINADKIEEKIKQILSKQLGVDINKIKDTSKIVVDLGADSLDKVEIFLKLEKEFNININKEERKSIKEVKEVIDYIKSKIKP